MATLNQPQDPPSIEEETLLKSVNIMRKRMALLQNEIDRAGTEWIKTFSVASSVEAQETRNHFDKNWFAKSLYSKEMKQSIAKTLIKLIAPYSFIDISIWEAIAKG